MNIEFTKEQYEQLIKVVYLGNWMANADRTDDAIAEYEDIQEYILSHAKDFGVEHLAETDEESEGQFFPSRELESDENVERVIEEYDDDAFWEELIERLTIKEIFSLVSEDALKEMKEEDFVELYESVREKYEEEFEESGLMNLDLCACDDEEGCCGGTCDSEKGCC